MKGDLTGYLTSRKCLPKSLQTGLISLHRVRKKNGFEGGTVFENQPLSGRHEEGLL